jgi:hypothetical protein
MAASFTASLGRVIRIELVHVQERRKAGQPPPSPQASLPLSAHWTCSRPAATESPMASPANGPTTESLTGIVELVTYQALRATAPCCVWNSRAE